MRPLEIYSEQYSPTGNVTSEGVLNQLGRPKLDILAVLMREAVQNSWDARLPNTSSISFGVAGWTLSERQRKILKSITFRNCPPDIDLEKLLQSSEDVQLLAIYDRKTEGLGGPTRADHFPEDNEPANFVDFLRNVGQPPDKELSGGTYGYGKAVFYKASKFHTIMVHTRCLSNQQLQSRFMGAALGYPYTEDRRRYTGRHWWGKTEDGVIEPLLNRESELMASNLGFPSFEKPDRGTSIVIVQPDWGEKTPIEALNLMAEYLLWYFWPKMLVTDSGLPAIQFELSWNGEPIILPNPSEFAPLEGFVLAMNSLTNTNQAPSFSPAEIYEIRTNQYDQYLGKLALQRFPVKERAERVSDETAPIRKNSHHVALMRQPELVVRYMEGYELPSNQIQYAGVFITDRTVDSIFAESEPPTHDDWISTFLGDRRKKVFVNSAFREIRKKLDEFIRPLGTQTVPGKQTPLGAFANQLGSILPGQSGTAAFANLFARRRKVNRIAEPEANYYTHPNTHPTSDGTQAGWNSSGSNTRGKDPDYFGVDKTSDSKNRIIPVEDSTNSKEDSLTAHISSQTGFTNSQKALNPGRVRITHIDDGDLIVLDDGTPAIKFEFGLQFYGDPCTATLACRVGAILEGNELESDPPEGDLVPEILYWINQDSEQFEGSNNISIASSSGGTWAVIISIPSEIMIGINLSATVERETSG